MKHIEIHKSGVLYKCDKCTYVTFNKENLGVHTVRHLFRCNKCDFSAYTEYSLSRHKKSHLYEQKYLQIISDDPIAKYLLKNSIK